MDTTRFLSGLPSVLAAYTMLATPAASQFDTIDWIGGANVQGDQLTLTTGFCHKSCPIDGVHAVAPSSGTYEFDVHMVGESCLSPCFDVVAWGCGSEERGCSCTQAPGVNCAPEGVVPEWYPNLGEGFPPTNEYFGHWELDVQAGQCWGFGIAYTWESNACNVTATFTNLQFTEGREPVLEPVILGCGVNPSGSLSVISGLAKVGESTVFGLDNPLGTQSGPASTFLAVSLAPYPSSPCGLLLAGFGMEPPGLVGELLIDPLPPSLLPLIQGPAWQPGEAAPIELFVPDVPELVGLRLWVQGAIVDPTASQGAGAGLTDAARIRVVE